MNLNKQILSIENESRTSEHIVGCDLLQNIHTLGETVNLCASKILLLSDETVFQLYGDTVIRSLQNLEIPIVPSIIQSGESEKSLQGLKKAVIPFFQSGFKRDAVLICLGGGVITDLGGLIGSLLLRGIKTVYIPTTLLGQIDAAIGGKTGIDIELPGGRMLKNMLGNFHFTELVISDINVLKSLPQSQTQNGLGEMAKYSLGWNSPTLDILQSIRDHSISSEDFVACISACQTIKISIVQSDPYEQKGLRESLNLGHTFAHAIESASKFAIPHGYAVALGLICAAFVSVSLSLCDQSVLERVKHTIQSLGFLFPLPDLKIEDALASLAMDKKGGTFVCFEGIGALKTRVKVPRELVIEAFQQILI